jgi:hypothetical protein
MEDEINHCYELERERERGEVYSERNTLWGVCFMRNNEPSPLVERGYIYNYK